MPADFITLAWNRQDASVTLNNVTVTVVPAEQARFPVDAVVHEQDTSLVLGEFSGTIQTEEKPAWFLANKLESQICHNPGQVLVSGTRPFKLYAIIHDLDQQPSWCIAWISTAVENLIQVVEHYSIHSLQLPVLGNVHGHFELNSFIDLLFASLKKRIVTSRLQISLLVAMDQYPAAIKLLHKYRTAGHTGKETRK